MIEGLKAAGRALNHWRLQGYAYIWANVSFLVLCLPVVSAPAAFSALMRIGHAAHRESHESDLALFWQTTREHLWLALPWGLAHALFAIVNFGNLWMYAEAPGLPAAALRIVWWGLGLVWLGVVLYTWPIYYEMETPTLWGATRNALVMVLQNPFFTVTIILVLLFLSVISTVLIASWVLLTWGCIAAIANGAVLNRLTIYREIQRIPNEDAIH